MSKYIDADLFKKEIDRIEEEARKVRVSGTDKEAIGADGKVSLCLKLKSFIDSLQQEQYSDDFDEAIARYGSGYCDSGLRRTAEFGFRSGAEWQRQRTPMPEDTVIFQKGIKEGKRLMMEDAVEGMITCANLNRYILVPKLDESLTYGHKVKIIIVKEDEK